MNTNCLEGIKCPKCGQEERFSIVAEAVFTVTDDGTEAYEAVEWDDDNHIRCVVCDKDGKVSDFRVKEE